MKQHFIPQFVLKTFSDSSRKIYCGSKETGQVYRKSIRHVAMEEDLYKIDNLDRLEENDLSFVLQKIGDSNVILDSTKPQHQCMSLFTMMINGEFYTGHKFGNGLESFYSWLESENSKYYEKLIKSSINFTEELSNDTSKNMEYELMRTKYYQFITIHFLKYIVNRLNSEDEKCRKEIQETKVFTRNIDKSLNLESHHLYIYFMLTLMYRTPIVKFTKNEATQINNFNQVGKHVSFSRSDKIKKLLHILTPINIASNLISQKYIMSIACDPAEGHEVVLSDMAVLLDRTKNNVYFPISPNKVLVLSKQPQHDWETTVKKNNELVKNRSVCYIYGANEMSVKKQL